MAVRDVVQAAAGQGGDDKLYVEDVFSTYLYKGNGSTQTITNGIDLDGEGGLVWIKDRFSSAGPYHAFYDTNRGASSVISSNSTDQANAYGTPTGFTAFGSAGFSLGSDNYQWVNKNTNSFASWTFRKAPKFFDVVTYTGTGVNGRTVAHNLESTPGFIIVKQTSAAGEPWYVYHRSLGTNTRIYLSSAAAASSPNDDGFWTVAPTSTEFSVAYNGTNKAGSTYVAYVFAHDAGGFGDDGEQNIISCGSYTGNGSAANGPEINLGWEPQWIMVKDTSQYNDPYSGWIMFDTMRGWASATSTSGIYDSYLWAQKSNAEAKDAIYISPLATGFKITQNAIPINTNGSTYIYIAIRRPMKKPESGTEVFATDNMTNASTAPPGLISGFPVDFAIEYQNVASGSSANTRTTTRLLGETHLQTSSTAAEVANTDHKTDYQNGFFDYTNTISDFYAHMFRRAPSVFDVVAYTGNGTAGRTIAHNLGVAPELIITKRRNANSSLGWIVSSKYWFASTVWDRNGRLNQTSGLGGGGMYQPASSHSANEYPVSSFSDVNASSGTYVAYLFATLAGVSKVGRYTGTGADLNVDCGFSAGARFILIKRADSTGDWYVWDSVRGIVSGNDPYLLLNSTAGQVTTTDYIDPLASGFTVTSSAPAALNASGGSYIFLAIA
jgi:hypothetical protein